MALSDKLPDRTILFIGVFGSLAVTALFLAVELCYFSIRTELDDAAMNRGAQYSEVQDLKAEQSAELSQYSVVDEKTKIVTLPIERAMEVVVADYAK